VVGYVGFSDITTYQGSWHEAFGVDPDTKLPVKNLRDFKKKVFCVKVYQCVKFLHTRPSYVLPTNRDTPVVSQGFHQWAKYELFASYNPYYQRHTNWAINQLNRVPDQELPSLYSFEKEAQPKIFKCFIKKPEIVQLPYHPFCTQYDWPLFENIRWSHRIKPGQEVDTLFNNYSIDEETWRHKAWWERDSKDHKLILEWTYRELLRVWAPLNHNQT
jgi:hypothetical protein